MSTTRAKIRDCQLDAEVVTRVLREQFPQLASCSVSYLGAGWDHEAYEIDGEWIVRMPMRAEVAARVPVERAALEIAREVMTAAGVQVPELGLLGAPGVHYPYPFSGYRKLPGVIADLVALDAFSTRENARVLGRALGALHRVPIARAEASAVSHAAADEHSAADRARRVLQGRSSIEHAIGPARAQQCAAFLALRPLIAPDAGARVLRHDDLHLEHILVDPSSQRVTGIIDWTDASIGDPAGELVLLWLSCGEPFVRELLDAYDGPLDGGLLERVRIRARWSVLDWILRSLARDPHRLQTRFAAFDRAFPAQPLPGDE